MKKVISTILLVIFTVNSVSFAAEFGGVRSWGMGQAFAAYKADVNCIYHNPAGVVDLETSELCAGVGTFYDQNQLTLGQHVIFTWPWEFIGNNMMAVHVNSHQYEEQNLQQTGFSFAGNLDVYDFPLSWGTSVKMRTESIEGTQSFLMDLGVRSDWEKEKISLGLSLKNLFSNNEDLAKLSPVLGLAYHASVLDAYADFSWVSSKVYLSMGIEKYLYRGLLAFRTGFYNSESSFITAGLSSYLWPVGFDVSFAWPVDSRESGFYQFALRYRFGGEHFSEVYLNRSLEKAVSVQTKIKYLELKRKELYEILVESGVAPREEEAEQEVLLYDQEEKARKEEMKKIIRHKQKRIPKAKTKRKTIDKKKVLKQIKKPKVTGKKIDNKWPKIHVVKSGDNLRKLSEKYYGDANRWRIIYNANSMKIERGQPRIGSELVIPDPRLGR